MPNTPIPNILIPLYDNNDHIRLSNLFNGLILFEKVIVDSRHLGELRPLLKLIGVRNVKRLIKSGKLDIKGGHITTAVQLNKVVGNDYLFLVLPMQLAPIQTKDKSIQELIEFIDSIHEYQKSIFTGILNLYNNYIRDQLISNVNERYLDYSDDKFSDYTSKVHEAISEDNVIRDALISKTFQEYLDADKSNRVQINREEKHLFRVSFSNSASSQSEVELLQQYSNNFFFSIDRLVRNKFNEYHFNSMIGFKNNEIEFQQIYNQYIYNKFNADHHFERQERVLNINNLPSLDEDTINNLRFRKFYKAIHSKEIVQFRNWLWNIDNKEENEIIEKVNKLTKYIDRVLRIKTINKSFDLLQSLFVSNTLGDQSGLAGEVSGSMIDKYVFSKLKRKDHFTFINDIYPSIFNN